MIISSLPWVVIQMLRVDPEIVGQRIFVFTRNEASRSLTQQYGIVFALGQGSSPPSYGESVLVRELLPLTSAQIDDKPRVAAAVTQPLPRDEQLWRLIVEKAQPKVDREGRTLPTMSWDIAGDLEVRSDGLIFDCPCQAIVQAVNAARAPEGLPAKNLMAMSCGDACPHTGTSFWDYPYPGYGI